MLAIDFETRSGYDLKQVGAVKYLSHPGADIVMLSYRNEHMSKAKLWVPGNPQPKEFQKLDEVYAFNAVFDWRVWNILGVSKYGLPPLSLNSMIDVMALCGRYGFPQSLDRVSKVVDTRLQKLTQAKNLMKKICILNPRYTMGEMLKFAKYCLRDTDAMWELIQTLPADHLSDSEQQIWLDTVAVNRNGLPIDEYGVETILKAIEYEKDLAQDRISFITRGAITSVHQRVRILDFCADNGLHLPNLQAPTVEAALERDDLHPDVRNVLFLRKTFGKAATAKYSKLHNQIHGGRIYDNLRYYAGHTGRWGGLGFQAHNLFKSEIDWTPKEADIKINEIATGVCKQVMDTARNLVRYTIKAPNGKILYVADYSSIENVLIAQTAGEEYTLNLYKLGKDEYKDFATQLFHIEYDAVTSKQRTMCKPIILGAGYGLGAGGLIEYASGFGVDMSDEDSEYYIDMYRQTHPNVVNMWYALHNSFKAAIKNPGAVYGSNGVSFKMVKDRSGVAWMAMALPSGRTMYYNSPWIEVKEVTSKKGKKYLRENIWYMGWFNNVWGANYLTPGKLTENVIQALARDIMAFGVRNLLKAKYKVCLTVHDEVVIELWLKHKKEEVANDILMTMCFLEPWAIGLPLKAEGEFLERYKKL